MVDDNALSLIATIEEMKAGVEARIKENKGLARRIRWLESDVEKNSVEMRELEYRIRVFGSGK